MLAVGQLFESYTDFCQKYLKKLEFTPDGFKNYFIKLICIHGGTFKKSKKI